MYNALQQLGRFLQVLLVHFTIYDYFENLCMARSRLGISSNNSKPRVKIYGTCSKMIEDAIRKKEPRASES